MCKEFFTLGYSTEPILPRIEEMKVFTVGQVAKICKVAPRTVSKWFDSGRLKGYRIPGSQDRRIPRDYLIKFLKEHNMPLGVMEDESLAKILLISVDNALIESLENFFTEDKSFKFANARSEFEAGVQVNSFEPDCILVDFSMGESSALVICDNIRNSKGGGDLILLALLPDESREVSFDPKVINQSYRRPVWIWDEVDFERVIRQLINKKRGLN